MNSRQALASLLHLFVVFAFFIAGFFFVALPYLPESRVRVIDFFSLEFEKCTLVGLGFFALSLLLLVGFYALNRGRYLVIQMGVAADLKVVRQTVANALSEQFPKQIALNDVELGARSRLAINVTLAPLEEEAREALFIEAEQHLNTLLRARFGYSKPFYLVVSL